MDEIIISGLAALVALVFAGYSFLHVLRERRGKEKVVEIGQAIHEGAVAFLRREYKYLVLFVALIAAILCIAINFYTSLAYLIGAICSVTAGYVGMAAATRANMRTATAASKNLGKALRIAFAGGSVMGLCVVGLGLLGLFVTYSALSYFFNDPAKVVETIVGFGFGASSVALFARVGGGIYTKGADVGADLVGKVERGIPEDDPRNPAVIADQVGDNVGDIAGMGADLFESYTNSIIATMAIGIVLFGMAGIALPLLLAAAGIIASILGTFAVRTRNGDRSFQAQTSSARLALNKGTLVSFVLMIGLAYYLATSVLASAKVFYAVLAGLIAGVVIGWIVEYYTSDKNKPVQSIAEAAQTGPATNIITGLSVGMQSTALPILLIGGAILTAYYFAGLYGIAIAAVGMLAILGMVLSIDGYGPITDNAAGIAEMAGLGPKTRARAEALDSVGNTTAAIGKGFAIASAALTALALFAAYSEVTGLSVISITDPFVVAGLFVGGMTTFLFCALTMRAVGKTAFTMVNEVRRQFHEIRGLMSGRARPDYARCVDIATLGALREMIIPGTLAVIIPVAVGLVLGPAALGGVLAGAIVTGFLLAIMMANAGGAWDNAKKYIEAGNLGGKGSSAHKAAVVGDTVGDPCKDCSGPSINILIKLMSIVALVFAPLFI